MLGKSFLNLDEVFDPATLWRLLPSALPGRVSRYLGDGRTRGFVEVLVDVRYPDGVPMAEVYCKELDGRPEGELVLFRCTPASDWERQKKNQPNLVEATAVRNANRADINEAIQQVDAIRNNGLARELQLKIRSVEAVKAAERAKIQKEAQEQAAQLKKIEMERLAALTKTEESRLAALAKTEADRLAALAKTEKDRLAAVERTEKERLQ
jgi:hypothetical protein